MWLVVGRHFIKIFSGVMGCSSARWWDSRKSRQGVIRARLPQGTPISSGISFTKGSQGNRLPRWAAVLSWVLPSGSAVAGTVAVSMSGESTNASNSVGC